MNLKGSFTIFKFDGTVFHQQTMEFPNLNNEQAGQLSEYTDACVKDLKQIAKKPIDGTYKVTLYASSDDVGVSETIGEGLTYKDVVQFQRRMWHHQDKLIKFAEEQAAKPPKPKAA